MAPQPKPRTWRSEKYKAFIRQKPCCICGGRGGVAHHESVTKGKGMRKKPSDVECLPMCELCHALRHSPGYRADQFWAYGDPAVLMLRNLNDYLSE
jgi:hypothetical protein